MRVGGVCDRLKCLVSWLIDERLSFPRKGGVVERNKTQSRRSLLLALGGGGYIAVVVVVVVESMASGGGGGGGCWLTLGVFFGSTGERDHEAKT